MYRNTTGRAIYVNADKSKTVEENDPEAAFLLVGPNGELPDAEAEKYGLKGEQPKEKDRVEQLREAEAAAMERGATEEARVHRANADAAEAEEKARKSGPENKAGAAAEEPKPADRKR